MMRLTTSVCESSGQVSRSRMGDAEMREWTRSLSKRGALEITESTPWRTTLKRRRIFVTDRTLHSYRPWKGITI